MFLRQFYRKYPRILKTICITAGIGTGWLYYEVQKTGNIISNALDTSVLSIEDTPIYKDRSKADFLVINLDKLDEEAPENSDNQWKSLKFILAKHLIRISTNENQFIRQKAIRQLAKIKSLDHWQYQVLSNMLDPHAAVALARMEEADSRFFPKPTVRDLIYSQNKLENVLKDLLISLYEKSGHHCLGYFISKAFVDVHELLRKICLATSPKIEVEANRYSLLSLYDPMLVKFYWNNGQRDVSRLVDFDSPPLELREFIMSSHRDVFPACLESLLHHATIGDFGKDIVELNGLPLLMEIYNRFQDDLVITATICRILAYLSMHKEFLEDLFKYGWIGVLAKLVKHEDIRISISAAKALANLDVDDDSVYQQRLYPLHPTMRTVQKIDADIVFVHGLLGGVFFTWRQRDKSKDTLGLLGKRSRTGTPGETITHEDTYRVPFFKKLKEIKTSDPDMNQYMEDLEEHLEQHCVGKDFEVVWEDLPTNSDHSCKGPFSCPGHQYHFRDEEETYTYCWPKDWLAEDCNNLRIIGVNYETNLSLWASICPIATVRTLEERSKELVMQLQKTGLGKRPIIWVTHSMGGLIVKDILCKTFESADKDIRSICLNTKGIVFYSTPHTGSNVAKLSQATALILWPSIEVQELEENSKILLDIHEKFLNIIKEIPIKLITFIETKATVVTAMKFKFQIVEPSSGNPGVGEYYEIPQDHLGICKPANRNSFIYQKVLHFIKDILLEDSTN